MKSQIKTLAVFTFVGSLLLVSFAGGIQAATFNIADGNVAALESAIEAASTNNQDDIINLAAGGSYIVPTNYNGTYAYDYGGDSGHTLTIEGNGATIMRSSASGTPSFRILGVGGGGALTLNDLTISNGYATHGAGVYVFAGVLSVYNCTFSGNNTNAIYSESAGNVYLWYSTFVNNNGDCIHAEGALHASRCTFANNSLWAINASGSAAACYVFSCTISGNIEGILWGTGYLDIRNTILKRGSSSPNLKNNSGGGIFLEYYNLSDDDGGGFLIGTGDQISTDPKLDPNGLQDNGGPTQTIKLMPGSPAIDKGHGGGEGFDQRGAPRPADDPSIPNASGGDGSDIGAFEVDLAQQGTALSVTTADDHDDGVCGAFDCSLREAIKAANNDTAPNTINITATGTMALQASLGPLAVTDSTTIVGPGARLLTVDAGGATEVFSFASGTTSAISGLTISNGKITSTLAQGAGILNQATLTVSDCQLMGNAVQGIAAVTAGNGGSGNGGAIYNGGILTLRNCTLSGNSARGGNGAPKGQFTAAGAGGNGSGGAVYNDTNATLTLTNCTLTNNSGTGANGGNSSSTGGNGGNGRGGIYNRGAMTVTACTISGNTGTEGFGGNGSPSGALGTGDGGLTNIGTGIIGDTICAANTGNNGANDLDGSFTSNGYNLIGSGTHSTGFINGTNHDQVGTDASPLNPHLQALQNNGGATDTMALFSISSAVNNGDPNAPAQDSRYYLRSGVPDIGAFEYVGTLAPAMAKSMKTHGSTGSFGTILPITGPVGIECRSGGATNDHQIVVTFPTQVTVANASITSGIGSVNSYSVAGSQVTVNLTGVANAQQMTITLSNANDGVHTNNVTIPMKILLGDTTGDGSVNSADIGQTKSKSGQTVDATNFRNDVNVDGALNSGDIGLVKSKSGTGLSQGSFEESSSKALDRLENSK